MPDPLPIALAAVLLLAAAPGDEDWIRNGDLEAGQGGLPEHWTHTGGSERVSFTWELAPEGRGRCLALHCTDPKSRSPHNWSQRIELEETRPARLELSARVRALEMHPEAQACATVQLWDAEGGMTGGAWTDRTVEDSDWHRVDAVFDVPEDCVALRVLVYLVGRGRIWVDDIALIETEREPRSSHEAPHVSGWERLARRCADEIPWLFDAEEALASARRERRPILAYVRCIDEDDALASGLALDLDGVRLLDDGLRKDLLMRAGPLSDPEVGALIERRFVPLILTYDLSRHGMGPSADDPLRAIGEAACETVTPALIVLDPRGERVHKLHRIGTLSAPFVDQVLRVALLDSRSRPPEDLDDPMELYLAGELDGVLKAVEDRSDEAARVLRARVLRRRGTLDAAEAELEGLTGGEAQLERGLLEAARGRHQAAIEILDQAIALEPGPRREEAAFRAAWCAHRLGLHEDAHERFEAIAGDSRFGRKAAACLLREGPRPPLAETARARPTTRPLAPRLLEAESTENLDPEVELDLERALGFLLEQQRHDGSFGGHTGAVGGGSWDAAISGIVGEALLRWRERAPEELRVPLDECLEEIGLFLDRWSQRNPSHHLAAFNDPYGLLYVIQVGRPETAQRFIRSIADSQQADGCWTVYEPERPTSFNTALNLRALLAAREAGFEVPEEILISGLEALEAMRTSAGLFPYSTQAGHEWMTTPHGAIARDPLCESTLLAAGRGSKRLVREALERFEDHCGELREPTKKLYDYFNARGHGGYYQLFAWRNAVDASGALTDRQRARFLRLAATHLAMAREFDGTWIDQAMLGRAYGTAMALYVLGAR